MLYTFISNELLVFLVDQYNHYQLHHFILNEKNILENNQQIEIEHCYHCCLDKENKPMKTKLISCSHFLSFINLSCEIEDEENTSNIHFVNLDTHPIN
jgi:hypothetical protein